MKYAILLSIHPEHVKKIISGEKKFEFRKVKTRKYQPNKIFIYSTAPDSFIIAEADITEILEEHPDKVWNKTKKYAGVNHHFFIEYYKNKEKAIAYKLENVREFDRPKKLEDLGIKTAPQSFVYLDSHKIKKIRKQNNY